MVEILRKYWLERNPASKLKEHMKYLMPGKMEYIDEKYLQKI